MSDLLTEKELLDKELSDQKISEVFYRGNWDELKYLKHNEKFKDSEDVWVEVSKDYEFYLKPWYPVVVFLFLMVTNLLFNLYDQFYSLLMAIVGLIYVSKIIPILNNLKENNRIKYLDKILENTPYNKNNFIKKE